MFNTMTAKKGYLAGLATLAAGTVGGCDQSLILLIMLLVLPVIRYNTNKLYQLYSMQHTVGGVS